MNTSDYSETASINTVRGRPSSHLPIRTISHADADFDDTSSMHTLRRVGQPDSFARVNMDAELFSLDRTESSATSTVYGLGSTTGHGLMAMGEWILGRVDSANALARVQSVVSLLRNNRGNSSKYKTKHAQILLEYQR